MTDFMWGFGAKGARGRAFVSRVALRVLSRAVVVPRVRRGRACHARYGAQILVDSPEVTVSHVVINGPRHYLEKSAIERRRNASPVGGTSTGRMEVVHVNSSPDDLNKLLKRVTSFRQACFVRR